VRVDIFRYFDYYLVSAYAQQCYVGQWIPDLNRGLTRKQTERSTDEKRKTSPDDVRDFSEHAALMGLRTRGAD
jgi:hypothetical protein